MPKFSPQRGLNLALHGNKTALGAIIESLRIDWRMIISRMKYNYSDDYENNKKGFVRFKREVSDPLKMGLDISDDEETEEV
jgi:hypothetical protein